jgi:hypothetical protein
MRAKLTNDVVQELTQIAERRDVRAILFDLDDTLFDHQHCSRAGLVALREGFPTLAAEPFDAFELRYRILLEEVHLLVLSGALTPAAARLNRFHRFLSAAFSATVAEAERAGGLYQAAFRAARRPVAGAVEPPLCRPSRGLRPKEPLRLQAACPGRALSRAAWLWLAAAACWGRSYRRERGGGGV